MKRHNAREIADLFSTESGKFVCASAGHHLEALMAAHGSGAVDVSRHLGKTVLNIDVGGGTTKLTLVDSGKVLATAAFAVGGRLLAFDKNERLTRIEPSGVEIAGSAGLNPSLGEVFNGEQRQALASAMANIIAEIASQGPTSDIAKRLMLTDPPPQIPPVQVITFSGGISEYIFGRELSVHADLGDELASAIVSALESKKINWPVYDPGQGIRATVIGASQFSVQVSGNTILISDEEVLPLRNIPVASLDVDLAGEIDSTLIANAVREAITRHDGDDGRTPIAMAFTFQGPPYHSRLFALARGLRDGLSALIGAGQPIVLVMEGDVGRALGRLFGTELDVDVPVISIDGVQLQEFDYIDIGQVIRPTNVVPLVIKSLLFSAPVASS